MIYIFHGDDVEKSRHTLNSATDQIKNTSFLRLDVKEVDLEKVNLFLNNRGLFNETKALVLYNPFSLNKAIFDKLIPLINISSYDIYFWQDKNLTLAQLKNFSGAKIQQFRADNALYTCLNSVKPRNLRNFCRHYDQVIKKNLYDLFLYLLKNNLRRQLATSSSFNQESLRKIYLQLIELDYQNKTGQLVIPREIALKRILINLLK